MNNRVKELRTERGLSQQQLGEAMDVSRQTINSIEKERYTPSLPLAIALARYFGTYVEEIFHVDDHPDPTDPMSRLYRTRWFMPAFCALFGALMFVAFAIGGDAASGAFSAAVLPVRRRRLLLRRAPLGDARRPWRPGRDERWERIDVHATALAGLVLILVIIGAWLVEIAQGKDGSPYAQLGAVGGDRVHPRGRVPALALLAPALRLRGGAARAWWPIRSSKPAGRRSPAVGRFDSFAAPFVAVAGFPAVGRPPGGGQFLRSGLRVPNMSRESRPLQPISGHVFRVDRRRGPQWYAKYRLPDGRQVQRRIGPAWTGRGRPAAGWFTKRSAQAWLDDLLIQARRGELPEPWLSRREARS